MLNTKRQWSTMAYEPYVPPTQLESDPAVSGERPDAIITLAYYDAEGRLVDSEELHVSPDAGSVWIKASEKILGWPTVRTVRASLARSPITPVDIDVHVLPPPCEHRSADADAGHPDRF